MVWQVSLCTLPTVGVPAISAMSALSVWQQHPVADGIMFMLMVPVWLRRVWVIPLILGLTHGGYRLILNNFILDRKVLSFVSGSLISCYSSSLFVLIVCRWQVTALLAILFLPVSDGVPRPDNPGSQYLERGN
jgi:hypothetical protein